MFPIDYKATLDQIMIYQEADNEIILTNRCMNGSLNLKELNENCTTSHDIAFNKFKVEW